MSEENKPVVASKTPYGVDLDPGTYFWCACGKSQKQPFCDGSHKGSSFVPQKVDISEKKTYWMCGCKATGGSPFCDGSHKNI